MQIKNINLGLLISIGLIPAIMTGIISYQINSSVRVENINNKSQLKLTKEENKKLNSKVKKLELNAEKLNNQKIESIQNQFNDAKLKSFFNTIFNYDNSTFKSRMTAAKAFSDQQPINIFNNYSGRDDEGADAPKTSIKSDLISYNFYPDVSTIGSNSSGIAVVKVNLTYQGQVQHFLYEYDVQLKSDGQVQHLVQRIIDNSANGSDNEE